MKIKNIKAFTLIEFMIIVAILVIIAAIAIPAYNDYMLKKSEPWEPYRTIACYYLWRLVDDEDFW